MDIILSITFITIPRLIILIRWTSGIIGFCNSDTNYIILASLLSCNFLHISNRRKLIGILLTIIVDYILCCTYIMECLYPNNDIRFIIVIIASTLIHIGVNLMS